MKAAGGLFRHAGYRDLLIGQAVSSFGDWLGTFALMALVLHLTGSAAAVGGVLVLQMLPAGIAGPVVAKLAWRWDRRHIMLVMNLLSAGVAAVIPLVPALWWVYLWAFVLQGAGVVFLPARDASLPDLVDEGDLPTANGMMFVSSYGNIPLGAGAFSLIQAFVPAGGPLVDQPFLLAFWIDAATFLVSYAFIQRLDVLGLAERGGERAGGQARAHAGGQAPARTGGRARAGGQARPPGSGGMREALRLPVVRAIAPAAITAFLGIGALFSLGLVFVRQALNASPVEFGVLVVLFGVGGAVGWLIAQRQRRPSLRAVRLALALMGIVLSLLSLATSVPLAYIAAPPFGAAASLAAISTITYLQEHLAAQRRVLGLAAFHVATRIGLSAAALAAGAVADVLRPTRLPVLGALQPSALVLCASGLLVVAAAAVMPSTEPGGGEPP